MYQVVFTPAAANQYAEVEDRWSEAPKRLATFRQEIDAVVDRLQNMPESYPPKGNMRAARLAKSLYYLFYRIEDANQRVVVVMLIHQRQDPANWPG